MGIFSAMNSLIKDKIKGQKDEIKTLDLSKDNIKDKVEMQTNFIKELESQGKERIEEKNGKINLLEGEIQDTSDETECLMKDVEMFTKDLEQVTGAKDKLKKLNTLKGKMSNKVATITKEHKFFTENTVCPTCTQNIEEEFRVNRIADAQTKAKELQTGYRELEDAIQKEEEREHQFTKLSKEITKLNNGISKNHTLISGCNRQIRDLESEIQRLTDQHVNKRARSILIFSPSEKEA